MLLDTLPQTGDAKFGKTYVEGSLRSLGGA